MGPLRPCSATALRDSKPHTEGCRSCTDIPLLIKGRKAGDEKSCNIRVRGDK